MGCDIHGYIEYKRFDNLDNPYWDFAGGLGTRDYAMFGLLANVRGGGCIYEPRGIPKDVSSSVKWEFCLYISESGDEDTCTKENAERWVKNGISEWANDEHTMITHPDWHTPSWLSTEEFEIVLNKRKEMEWGYEPEWDAILASMKVLPGSRFVFWFDN